MFKPPTARDIKRWLDSLDNPHNEPTIGDAIAGVKRAFTGNHLRKRKLKKPKKFGGSR